jgi:hypothetical protein
MIEGTTSHKLDKIKTYKRDTPYVEGVNGVKLIERDDDGNILNVTYIIEGIEYTTNVNTLETTFKFDPNNPLFAQIDYPQGSTDVTFSHYPENVDVDLKIPNLTTQQNQKKVKTVDGKEVTIVEEPNHLIGMREEAKIGLTFEPKTSSEIFIERQQGSVLEQHERLSEITNLSDLEDYRNGYYYIKKEF